MNSLQFPPVVHWEVTPNCNHNCIHCYNYWRSDDAFSIQTNNNLYEIAKKIISLKPVSVVVTGGEPLLVFNDLIEPLAMLRNRNINVSINTNATLVNSDIARFLKDKGISAFVSFPCYEKEICDNITNSKNSLDKISKGIKILLEHGVKVSVNMVVSKLNINYIYDTAKYVKENLGINRFFASRVSKPINSTFQFDKWLLSRENVIYVLDELLRIQKELKMEISTAGPIPTCSLPTEDLLQQFAYQKTCTAGRYSYCIDYCGYVKACARDSEVYGNILQENFHEIWARMVNWRDNSYLPQECNECNVIGLCRGGCRLDSFPLTCRKDSLDPIAKADKKLIDYKPNYPFKKYAADTKFYIPTNTVFVQETFGYRISVLSKYMYITNEFKDFLSEHCEFSIHDVMKTFNVDMDVSNNLVNSLLVKGIVFLKEV